MQNSKNEASKVELAQLFNQLKNDWGKILLYSLAGLLIAIFIAVFLVKPMYRSNADLLVNKESDEQSQYTTQQADLNAINTYEDVLKKSIILEPSVKLLQQKDNYKGTASTLASEMKISNQEKSQVITIQMVGGNRYVTADKANAVAQVFTKKIKEMMKINNVTIVSKAKPAKAAFAPNKKMYGLIGFLVGLFIGLLISILKFVNNTKVTNVEFLTEELGLPNLAVISHFSSKRG